jgi:hypothetical protein
VVQPMQSIEPVGSPAPVTRPKLNAGHLRPAHGGSVPTDSPARMLQETLERSWQEAPQERWSGRQTLAFVMVINGLFWASLICGVRALA